MKEKKKVFVYIVGGVSLILTLFSVYLLYQDKGNWSFNHTQVGGMYVEIGLLLVCLLATYFLKSSHYRFYTMFFVIAIFLWLHKALLPILFSGLYLFFLILWGSIFVERESTLSFFHAFVIGASMAIICICALSAMGLDIWWIRYSFYIFMIIVFIWKRNWLKIGIMRFLSRYKKRKSIVDIGIILICCIQAGRMNIALDYDSVRYGLRSPYVLFENGIFTNNGFVNDVYVYPKGLEILLAPLNFKTTYSFILAFSLCMMILTLYVVYLIVKHICNETYANIATLLVACIPAITNMGISAKTDSITLLLQLIFIASILYHAPIRYAFLAILFSFIFKPTSVVFSSIILFVSLPFVWNDRNVDLSGASIYACIAGTEIKKSLSVLFVLGSIGFVTMRTLLFTGLPMMSIFSEICESIGFVKKYPYAFGIVRESMQDLPENVTFLSRLYHMLLAPIGKDMAHVHIAWSGILVVVLLVVGCIILYMHLREHTFPRVGFLGSISVAVSVVSMLALSRIYQVDGNYFMLCYILIVIGILSLLYTWGFMRVHAFGIALLPAILWSVFFTMHTNWAGVDGFSLPDLVHFGYQMHAEDSKEAYRQDGIEDIYRLLEKGGGSAVFFTDDIEKLLVPIAAHTYTDITGSGGNVSHVKKYDFFIKYLDFCQTAYIYTEDIFLEHHERAKELVGYMLEEGRIEVLVQRENHTLYRYKGGNFE